MSLVLLLVLSAAVAVDLGASHRPPQFGFYDGPDDIPDLTDAAVVVDRVKNLKRSDVQRLQDLAPKISNQLRGRHVVDKRTLTRAAASLPEFAAGVDADALGRALPVIARDLDRSETVSRLRSLHRILP